MGVADRLDRRRLNRATLHRQLLLDRRPSSAVEAIGAVGGLNAQHANDPYLALHARLDGFERAELTTAIDDDSVVRACLQRAIQHNVTAAQHRSLQPALRPLLARLQRNAFGARTAGGDLEALTAETRRILRGRTMPRAQLGRQLALRWPGDADALAWTAQYLVPLVHPAPTGTWERRGPVLVALAEDRVGPPEPLDPRAVVRSHLAAFGPATPADIRAWSGVAGLGAVVEAMRTDLRHFRGLDSEELIDLADASRPERDMPAPVRLLGGFDDMLLAFADRSRIMTDEVRRRVCVGDLIEATVLIDGVVAGTWQHDRACGVVTLRPFTQLRSADVDAVTAEAARLLAFACPSGVAGDIRFQAAT